MKHNKLVRDKIPDIILAEGKEVSTKILSDKEYKAELEKKLMEECKEVLGSEGEKRLEELADVLEVMMAIAKLDGYYMDDIVVAARQKREKRGGFENKIFLIEDK